MAFTFHHSLASRAAVSVVVSLWFHEDIDSLKSIDGTAGVDHNRQYLFDLSFFSNDSKRRIHRLALQINVRDNASKLSIPQTLKRYLLEFVQVVGENLENWIEDHYRPPEKITEVYGHTQCIRSLFFDIAGLPRNRNLEAISELSVNEVIDVDLRKVLRWNPDGDLDLEQTGEALVRNENDSIKRFRLACAYCKDGEMLRLWPSVRDHFSSIEAWDTNRAYEVSALFWWRYFKSLWPESVAAYLLKLDTVKSVSGIKLNIRDLHMSCFHSFTNSHSPLTLYLINHLDLVDADSSDIIKDSSITDKRFGAIFFRMPQSYHDQALSDHPGDYFNQLLLWRHQSFFADVVERSWDIFDESLFDTVLLHIARGVVRYEDSDIYRLIFLRYWTGSPARLRNVERMFYDREVEEDGLTLRHYVDVLFGHSPAAEDRMKGLMYEGRHVLELIMRERTRDVLSELVRTCLPSEEWEEKLKLIN